MNNNIKTIVKASFKDCPIEERKIFHKSHCLMPISIGQKIHEGEKFIATMRLVERTFARCTILLDDSVQKYTLKIESETDLITLHQQAIEAGTDWLQRQKKLLLEELAIPCTVIRWDDWLVLPEYPENHKKVASLYNENLIYRDAIDNTIKDFLDRYVAHGTSSSFDYVKAHDLCFTYLLEECAVMSLWVKGEYDFELYPSGRNKAMAATYEFFIKNQYPNLLKSVGLRFKKYKNIIDQTMGEREEMAKY
ncbi:MAG: Uncharacterized protein K0R48_175 [Gammaproteobacteria bacterium]|nr:Uncharacterized protein [Gammaproteobacteria bacterium]